MTKCGSIITSRRANSRVWNRYIYNRPTRKSSKPKHLQETLCLVFWDSQGLVLEHYQVTGTTINSSQYSEMLTDRLKPAIRSKCRELLSKDVVLLHDNVHQHTAAHTAETLRKLKFEVMAHPPYSPDLSPSDYQLFDPLKEALRGHRFSSDQEVKEAVHAWLTAQPKTFFLECNRKLVEWLNKCVE